jgi:hypothetical protein
MKKPILFIIGMILGAMACFSLFYLSGLLLEIFGITLYESEAGQQRNFNIFIILSAIFSIGGGWLLVRKFA